ncbi:MAG: hypothetical protein EBY23_02950 [Actinobacteria bacterium]|nr:hypothetical protein [Actinomycetota bacterium]
MTTTTRRIGKYIAFVPAHCKLEREFRTEMGRWLRASSFDMVYGDSLHPTDDKYEEPIQVLRPGWSPERLRGHCYVGDVVLAAADLVARVGGADALCSLSTHHRALLLSEHASSIGRMPLFLYSAPWEHRFPSADLDAVTSHCLRTGIHAQCYLNDSGSGVIVKRTRNNDPSVTVIIPTRGTEAEVRGKNRVLAAHAIAQLVEHSAFQNFDIIVIVDKETPAHALLWVRNFFMKMALFKVLDTSLILSHTTHTAAFRGTVQAPTTCSPSRVRCRASLQHVRSPHEKFL